MVWIREGTRAHAVWTRARSSDEARPGRPWLLASLVVVHDQLTREGDAPKSELVVVKSTQPLDHMCGGRRKDTSPHRRVSGVGGISPIRLRSVRGRPRNTQVLAGRRHLCLRTSPPSSQKTKGRKPRACNSRTQISLTSYHYFYHLEYTVYMVYLIPSPTSFYALPPIIH
jgi:hypothetical protein